VTICERLPRIGKKILASGGGRCNLSNDRIDESIYNEAGRRLVRSVLSRFGKDAILKFFDDLGLFVYSDEGRIFPVTNQSSSVLAVLDSELKSRGVDVRTGFGVTEIAEDNSGFLLRSHTGGAVRCSKVILAGGGRSYPALGSDGSAYKLAMRFGHGLVEPVPSAVPVTVRDPLCHLLQGQKILAKARAMEGGRVISEASGEALFTRYGLSGTAILDISESLSIAVNRRHSKDVSISLDMAPFLDHRTLAADLEKRSRKAVPPDDLLAGLLPNKFSRAFKGLLNGNDFDKIAYRLKDWRFRVSGTRGWNEAEFTSGGIDTSGLALDTLESKLKSGLFMAGELLDVQGPRGGYNLAWAWASGFTAGLAA
jgi:predicted Rossmann fold flavoprotein